MSGERAAFLVMVDLDPVAGWGDNAGDWQRHLEAYLLNSVGHYNPVVVEFTPDDLEPMKKAERQAGAAEVRAQVESVIAKRIADSEDKLERYGIRGASSIVTIADLRAALNGGE